MAGKNVFMFRARQPQRELLQYCLWAWTKDKETLLYVTLLRVKFLFIVKFKLKT